MATPPPPTEAHYDPSLALWREAPIADPKRSALLFVDTQNYNCHRDGALYRPLAGAAAAAAAALPAPPATSSSSGRGPGSHSAWWAAVDAAVPKWVRLQAAARRAGVEVVYTVIQSLTRDGRDRSLDYKLSGFHVPPGCWDAQVLATIAPAADELVLPKTTSSVFSSTVLDYVLRNMRRDVHLIIAGAVTDQCVAHCVKDAADRGYRVTVVSDCCVARTPATHEAALASFAGYCRRRTLKELEEELEIAAELAAQAAAEDVQIYQ